MNYKKLYDSYGEFNILFNQLAFPSPSVEYAWRRTKKILHDETLHILELSTIAKHFVVDIGCGNGSLLLRLATALENSKKNISFTGIDISDAFIDYANKAKHYKNVTNITFIQQDIEKQALPSHASIVICSEVLEHLVRPHEFLKHVYESLVPGGYFLITTPNAINVIKYPLFFLKRMVQRKNEKELLTTLVKKEHTYKLAEHEQHLHVYTHNELAKALVSCGFVIKQMPRSTTFFGGPFLDNHPVLFAFTILFDSLMHLLPLPQLGWDSIVICQKPR